MKTRKHGKKPKHVTKKMRGGANATRNTLKLPDGPNNNMDEEYSNDTTGNDVFERKLTTGNDVFEQKLTTGDTKRIFAKGDDGRIIIRNSDVDEKEDFYMVGNRIIPAIRGAMNPPYNAKEWYKSPFSTRIAPGMPQHRYFNEEYTNMIENLRGLKTNSDTDSFFLHVNRHATSCNNMKLGKRVTGVNKDFEPGLPIDALYKTAYLGICRFRAQVSGGEWDPKFDLNKETNTPSETGLSLHTSCIAVSCLYRTWCTAILLYCNSLNSVYIVNKHIELHIIPYVKERIVEEGSFKVGGILDRGNMPKPLVHMLSKFLKFLNVLADKMKNSQLKQDETTKEHGFVMPSKVFIYVWNDAGEGDQFDPIVTNEPYVIENTLKNGLIIYSIPQETKKLLYKNNLNRRSELKKRYINPKSWWEGGHNAIQYGGSNKGEEESGEYELYDPIIADKTIEHVDSEETAKYEWKTGRIAAAVYGAPGFQFAMKQARSSGASFTPEWSSYGSASQYTTPFTGHAIDGDIPLAAQFLREIRGRIKSGRIKSGRIKSGRIKSDFKNMEFLNQWDKSIHLVSHSAVMTGFLDELVDHLDERTDTDLTNYLNQLRHKSLNEKKKGIISLQNSGTIVLKVEKNLNKDVNDEKLLNYLITMTLNSHMIITQNMLFIEKLSKLIKIAKILMNQLNIVAKLPKYNHLEYFKEVHNEIDDCVKTAQYAFSTKAKTNKVKGENDEMYQDTRYETAFYQLTSCLNSILDGEIVETMKANLEQTNTRDDSEATTYQTFIKNLMDTDHKFKQRIAAIDPNIFYKSGYAMNEALTDHEKETENTYIFKHDKELLCGSLGRVESIKNPNPTGSWWSRSWRRSTRKKKSPRSEEKSDSDQVIYPSPYPNNNGVLAHKTNYFTLGGGTRRRRHRQQNKYKKNSRKRQKNRNNQTRKTNNKKNRKKII